MDKPKNDSDATSSSKSSSDSEDNSVLRSKQSQPRGNTAERIIRQQQNAQHAMSETNSSDSSSDESNNIPKIENSSIKKMSHVADNKADLKVKQEPASSSDSSDSDSEDETTIIKFESGTQNNILSARLSANASEDWDSASDFGIESKVEGIITRLASPMRSNSPTAVHTPGTASKQTRNKLNPFSSTPAVARFSPLTTPAATAPSSSSASETGESESSSDDENVKRNLDKELGGGDNELSMYSSPSKKDVGKQLFVKEKPFNFECPDGFQEVEVKTSPVWQEDVAGKQLWLIKAPLDFDAKMLNGLNPDKMPTLIGKAETKDGVGFKWKAKTIVGKDKRVNDYSMVLPSRALRQPTYAGAFSGEVHISKCYEAPSYVIPASTKIPPQIPTGLKLRHMPFGSGGCVEMDDYGGRSADSALLSQSNKKHKKKKRNREDADTVDSIDSFIKDDGNIPLVAESDANLSLEEPKKKKKKKEKAREQEERMVIMDKIDDAVESVTSNTLDESNENEGKKKKKKKKNKDADSKLIAEDNMQGAGASRLQDTNDHGNKPQSHNATKKKSKKKKLKKGA